MCICVFFIIQKTSYEIRIRVLSSDVCSSDLVTTAYYVIVWQVVNCPDATVHPAGVRAVREYVAAAFAADPLLKDLTDADKQEAASIMAYMATLAAASASQLSSTGNRAALEQLQDQVHRAVLGQEIGRAHV